MALLRDDLIGQDRDQDRDADQVGHGAGMDHHQTGGHTDQTEHNVQLLEHKADQAGGDEEHTAEGGDDHAGSR